MQHIMAALQVVQAFAQAELGFSEEVRHEFREQHDKMSSIRAVLKQRCACILNPNYMQVLLVPTSKVCCCMVPMPCISQLVG